MNRPWGTLVVLVLGWTAPATEPPAEKPPWQRLLLGDDAKKAEELGKQVDQVRDAGKFAEALKLAEQLAALRHQRQGADHWEAVNARHDVEALRRVLKQERPIQAEYAHSFALQRDADTVLNQGRPREAQSKEEKVLAIRRQVLGEDHPDTANCYNNVAFDLQAQGKYQEAEEGFSKSLAVRRKVLGPDHPDVAQSYNNIARNLIGQGKYQDAEDHVRKALAIWSKVLGEDHPDTAIGYGAVAYILKDQGKYQEAEAGFRKALVICRKVLGEDHPDTSGCYGNVAGNLDAQGKYLEAEQVYRHALAISRKVQGEEHPDIARNLNNLANNLWAQGKYQEAEKAYRQALDMNRKFLGEHHPLTAKYLHNLAHDQYRQNKLQEAEDGFQKALAIQRKVLREDHSDTASSFHNLGLVLHAQGKYREAEDNFRKALAIYCKVFGEEHPGTALSYNNLANSLNAQGKYNEAESSWVRAADCFTKVRPWIAASGLERSTRTSEQSPLPSLAGVLARRGKVEAAWQRFEESLGRGTWDDLSARLRRPLADQIRQTQLVTQLDRLDRLIEKGMASKQITPELDQRRQELLTQRSQKQDELVSFVSDMEKKYGPAAGQVFDRAQIRAALPTDAALVGWLDLKTAGPKAADPNGEHWAVLLRSVGPPVWVRLKGSGPEGAWTEEDTALPQRLRMALQSPKGEWSKLADRLLQQRLNPLIKALAASAQLPAVRHLVVLPSTALAGVPLETVVAGYTVSYATSGTLYAHLKQQPAVKAAGLLALGDPVFEPAARAAKEHPLPPSGVLLTVVQPGANAAQAGLRPDDVLLKYADAELKTPADLKTALMGADPKSEVPVRVWRDGATFERRVPPGKLGVVLADKPASEALAERYRLDRVLASRSGDDGWKALPGTRVEVQALRRLFADKPDPKLLFDSNASEQKLDELAHSDELGQYRYLHLATHGEVDDKVALRSALILSRDKLPDPEKQLLEGKPIYDGRLTAEEMLRNWHLNSELVTLSACQTALGKYERGEGFMGFAQALLLCGSRSVCLSLWKVDDAATALLMQRFYQNLLGKREGLKGPLPKAAALREAKEWLRTLPRDEALRVAAELSQGVERGKERPKQQLLPPLPEATAAAKEDRPYGHPYYWAAFVLIGDPD